MQKKEAKFQTKFNQYCRDNKFTGAFELKQCDTSLPFDRVQDHQINSLLAAKNHVLAYKLSDQTQGFKPFDSFSMSGVPAYVVVLFGSKNFYGIDIDKFVNEKEASKRRSFTEDRAKMLCSFSSS